MQDNNNIIVILRLRDCGSIKLYFLVPARDNMKILEHYHVYGKRYTNLCVVILYRKITSHYVLEQNNNRCS